MEGEGEGIFISEAYLPPTLTTKTHADGVPVGDKKKDILWPAELCSALIVVGLSACRPLLTRVTHFCHGAWSNTARVLGVSSRGAGSGQQGSGGGASMPQMATIGSGRAIKARGGDSQWLAETRLEEGEGQSVEGGTGPSVGEFSDADYSARSAADQDSTKTLILDPIPMEYLGRETKPE